MTTGAICSHLAQFTFENIFKHLLKSCTQFYDVSIPHSTIFVVYGVFTYLGLEEKSCIASEQFCGKSYIHSNMYLAKQIRQVGLDCKEH